MTMIHDERNAAGPIDPAVEGERLRMVRALIEKTLHEHGVVGYVVLGGRSGCFEQFVHADAPWCNVGFAREPGTSRQLIGLCSKAADYVGQPELREQHLAWSVGVVAGIARILAVEGINWLEAARQFDRQTGAEHTPFYRVDPRD